MNYTKVWLKVQYLLWILTCTFFNTPPIPQESRQAWAQSNYTQTNPQEGDSASEAGADGVVVRTEAEYAAAQAFARQYSGEWNVEKYFDGNQWKIYELGKRMAIVAYNFLNDFSYTTGGYPLMISPFHISVHASQKYSFNDIPPLRLYILDRKVQVSHH